ncbi:MAG: hypothetical protein GXP61_11410 [Epsilonproteobacteria bacterium]|nr:hypothetical protein [Campylobacterota bacterium]
MQAIYNLNSNELNINFLNSIKEIFQNKNIDIIITDNTDIKLDDRSIELQNRFKQYKLNPKIATPLTPSFWKDNEKRLTDKYQSKAI